MQLSHMRPVAAVRFDEPNLVSSSGLVPVMALADKVGLADVAQRWLTVPTDKGSNAGGKVTALVAGIELWHISPGALQYLRANDAAQVLIGSHTADDLGVATGSTVRVRQFDTTSTVEIVPAQGPRTAAVDRAILTVLAPSEAAGTCYVEVPGSDPNTTAAWLALALGGTDKITVIPLVNAGDLGANPAADQRSRALRWIVPTAPLLSVFAWILLLRARRAELVLPRIFGTSRPALTWQLLMEFLACLVLALPPAVAAIAAGAWGDRVSAIVGTSAVAVGAFVVILVAVPLTYLMTIRRGSELAAIRSAE